jgi:hypoxanthine phosphoribosyltransferase
VVRVHDRNFREIITREQILARVEIISKSIEHDYDGMNPVFLPILNGSFMFAADLMRSMHFPCEIEFINAKSYAGVKSSGHVVVETHFNRSLKGRHLVILEDIVDTGLTMQTLLKELEKEEAASIAVATVLVKPEAMQVDIEVRYAAFEIGNEFVVGYGLDYDGLGRNLPGIYQEF